MNTTIEINRIHRPSYDEFVNEYVMPKKPVVLTGVMDHWPALKKWTPSFFHDQYGDKNVKVGGEEMKLGDYIDQVLASSDENPAPYLFGLFIRDEFPEIAPDIQPDLAFTLPDRLRSRWMLPEFRKQDGIPELLIAGCGGRFRLHYDLHHMLGFVTQIYGDKEFTLYPPDQTKFLYPKPEYPNHSQIDDIYAPDLDRFPLFAQAQPMRFVLRAGEVLYDPAGWWHTTKILTPSIAMVISTVHRVNWREFTRDVCAMSASTGIKPMLKQAYMAGLGTCLSVQERLNPPKVPLPESYARV